MSDMIWNGSYTLGNSQETQITAGTGIKVTTPAAGQIQISNDQTILWSNTTSYPWVDTVSLSEDWTLFQYIMIVTADQYGNGTMCDTFDTSSMSLSGNRTKRFTVTHLTTVIDTTNTMYLRELEVNFANGEHKNGSVLAFEGRIVNSGASYVAPSQTTRLVRIVGIQRK
jgi:hypothetical protein